jgi:hypothetical protein
MRFSLLAIPAISLVAQATVIVPGATWTDTSGNVIQAHGGGFLKVFTSFDRQLGSSKISPRLDRPFIGLARTRQQIALCFRPLVVIPVQI